MASCSFRKNINWDFWLSGLCPSTGREKSRERDRGREGKIKTERERERDTSERERDREGERDYLSQLEEGDGVDRRWWNRAQRLGKMKSRSAKGLVFGEREKEKKTRWKWDRTRHALCFLTFFISNKIPQPLGAPPKTSFYTLLGKKKGKKQVYRIFSSKYTRFKNTF